MGGLDPRLDQFDPGVHHSFIDGVAAHLVNHVFSPKIS
jgi:hypothetical protein